MATLEKIRSRAGVLVAVVIGLALLAFILGDLVSSGGTLFNQAQLELAEINGTSIAYDHYQAKVEEAENLQKLFASQGIDEQTTLRIREQVWQDLVRTHVMTPEYKQLGIEIHPDELFDMVQGRNIHPIISQQFADPNTGMLNKEYLTAFLQNLDSDPNMRFYWMYLEREMLKDRAFSKYTNLVRKGLYATTLQADEANKDRYNKVNFDYVVARLTNIADSLVSVSSSDIKAYYADHKNDYKQDETRDIEYVVFPLTPSEDDINTSEQQIARYKEELTATEEPLQYAELNSDKPVNPSYLNRDNAPADFRDWAFEAQVGEVAGPYSDGQSHRLARLVSTKMRPDSVNARHILIAPKDASEAAKQAAKTTADSLLAMAKRPGADWLSMAAKHSVDPGSKDKGGDLGWFPDGVMVPAFNDACFDGAKGQTTVVETQFGYHVIQIVDQSKPTKKVQLAVIERSIDPSSATIHRTYNQASSFAGQNTTYDKFNTAAAEQQLPKRSANNLLRNDRNIAGLTSPRELIRWAFKAKEGEVSNVFELGDQYVVATVRTARKEGIAPLEQVAQDIKAKVLREKKLALLNKQMAEALNGATSLAEVAQKLNTRVEHADGVAFTSYTLPNAGFEPAVLGTAVVAPEGKLTAPIDGNSGVFVLSVTSSSIDASTPPLSEERDRLNMSYQSRSYYEAYEALKEQAKIVDKRYNFY
ncbi:MAG: SurA N-terminal domain-containing protein [Bacteroidales bacterium]|nr:SurA N-terminal domain-containing protein [Bacteroidales bacterium]